MNKLRQDFGVTALFGTIILLGAFALLVLGVVTRQVNFSDLLVPLTSWVTGIVTGYIVGRRRGHDLPP